MFILIACVLLSGWVELGTSRCSSTTPLYFPNVWNCISAQECKKKSFVVYGRTCVHSCPPGTFYHQEASTCYNTCPVHTIRIGSRCLDGTFCVSNNNQVLFNGTCMPSCPSSAPFTKDGSCRKECPADTVTNKSDCVSPSDCIERGHFIDNTTCVKACPPEKQSILQGVCHSSCPPDKSVTVNGTACLSKQECTDKLGHFIYKNTCVPECPPTAIFSDQGSCTTLCPKEKCVLGTHCILVTECVHRKSVIFRNECIDACPAEAPHDKDNVCYSKCPKDYVFNNDTCIGLQYCISTRGLFKVIFNNTCVDSCPQVAPLNNQGMCAESCPGDTVVVDMQCVDLYVCVDSSKFIYNGTCVSECPGRSPYVASGKCRSECPDNTILFPGNKCVYPTDCTNIKGSVMYNRSCLPTCPPFAKYVHYGKCLSKCPRGFFANGSDCQDISNCKNVIYNESCLSSCPKEAPNRKDKNCYSTCPYWTYSYQATCIDEKECQEKKLYFFNRSCVPTCPIGFAGFTDYVCRDVMTDVYAITVLSLIVLMVLTGLYFMMYNSKKSRLMNAPAKLQGEQLPFRECDIEECVTSDNQPGQQQDNAEHPYEDNMELNSDEEMPPLEDHRNNRHDGNICHGVANCSYNVIVHPQRDADDADDADDVPLLQVTSEDDPLIQQADDAFLFGNDSYGLHTL